MIETKITCDGCDKNIPSTTGFMAGFYLELRSVPKKVNSGAVFSMYENSPIETKHFCGINCVGVYYHEKV